MQHMKRIKFNIVACYTIECNITVVPFLHRDGWLVMAPLTMCYHIRDDDYLYYYVHIFACRDGVKIAALLETHMNATMR